MCENASEGWDVEKKNNVMHLSFLRHLQIMAALLTELKSESNFPSWKCFSIDPHPELIGFVSCLRGNQITAENMCAGVCQCVLCRDVSEWCVYL